MSSTCCRLCLGNSDDLESIFSVKNGSLLMDLIKIICPIPIETAEDDLPQSVCQECVEIVTSAHQIRVMSVQSDFKLRSMRYRDPLIKSEPVNESAVFVDASENREDGDDSMQNSDNELDTFENKYEGGGRANKKLAKRLKCDRCHFRTSYKNTMSIHTRSHLKDDESAKTETRFQCNFCDNIYATRSDRQRHKCHEHQGTNKHAAKESFSGGSFNHHTKDSAATSTSAQARFKLSTDDRHTPGISGTSFNQSAKAKSSSFFVGAALHTSRNISAKRKSKVYGYFDIDEPNKRAKCMHCDGVTITLHATTLERHLERFHFELYTAYEEEKCTITGIKKRKSNTKFQSADQQ